MLHRILDPFKQFGWFGGSLYSINRLFHRLSPNLRLYYHYWMVQPIADKALLPEKYSKDITVREVKPGDPLLGAMDIPPEMIRFRFDQDAICLAIFVKDEFAGYIWFTFGRYDEDEARCTFVLSPEQQSAFDFNLYLIPKYRAGIAFIALWDYASKYLRKKGIDYSFSRMTAYKLVSAKSHSHMGMKKIGTSVVLRLWALEVIFASSSPYIFLSLNDNSRMQILLSASSQGKDPTTKRRRPFYK